MAAKEITPKEALEILYDERAFAYDGKVHSKSNKNWSEDIKHYDRIGEALITLRNALEENNTKELEISKEELEENKEKSPLEMLDYGQIDKEFGNLKAKYSIYKTDMFGNTWYLYHEKKRLFLKPKRVNDIILVCCCGVHRQTFIDILLAYHFTREELEVSEQ